MKIEIRCEGYLGRDFELKQSNRTNTSFAVGSLGVSNVVTNGNQPISNSNEADFNAASQDNSTAWFELTLFGDQVQNTYQFFQKGMRVEVVGTLTFSTFVDRSGQQREQKRIFVREIRHVCLPQLGPDLLNIQRQASANRQQSNQNNFNNSNGYNNNRNNFAGSSNQGGFGGSSSQGGFGGSSNQGGFGNSGSQGGFGNNQNDFGSSQGGFGASESNNSFGGGFNTNEGSVNSFAKNNNNFGSSSFPSSTETKTSKPAANKADDSDDIPF